MGMLLHTKPLATFRDVTAGKFDDVVALRSFLRYARGRRNEEQKKQENKCAS
jgi:hypothetical protein